MSADERLCGWPDVSFQDVELEPTAIDGLVIVRPKRIVDERGVVREVFRASVFPPTSGPWLQANVTETVRGAIRGLHGEDMTKLVGVISGSAFGAWVDARPDSPTCGAVVTLQMAIGLHVLVPPGVCNGFQATSGHPAQYLYLFDREWATDLPGVAVYPLDPALGIPWPIVPPILSAKDAALQTLAEVLR